MQVLDKADIVFAALFTTEMIMKLIAFGALRCGMRYVMSGTSTPCVLVAPRCAVHECFFFMTYPLVHTHRSYFLSKWNCLDGFVVTVSLVALAFPQASIFRAFRAMRLLRVFFRSKKNRVGRRG